MSRRTSVCLTSAWWLAMLVLLPQPACARQSQDAATQRERIEALVETGRYEDAAGAVRAALDGAADAEMANTLGEVLELQGELTEAEQAFRRAIEAGASDSLSARLNLAVLRWNRGERAEAMQEFDRFIDIYNRSDRLSADELIAVGTAVRYLGAEDPQLFKDALKAYDEAIAQDPDNVEARIRLGELFLDKYNSPDAQATFREVLQIDPRNPRALLGMARAKYFDGSAESLDLTRQALEINPNLVPARVFSRPPASRPRGVRHGHERSGARPCRQSRVSRGAIDAGGDPLPARRPRRVGRGAGAGAGAEPVLLRALHDGRGAGRATPPLCRSGRARGAGSRSRPAGLEGVERDRAEPPPRRRCGSRAREP